MMTVQQEPEGFTLEGEQSRATDVVPGIVARESEPDGVGGQEPGFDGSAVDDDDVELPAEPAAGDL